MVLLSTQNICKKLWVRKKLQVNAEILYLSKPMDGSKIKIYKNRLYFFLWWSILSYRKQCCSDEMPQFVALHLCFQCLPKYPFRVFFSSKGLIGWHKKSIAISGVRILLVKLMQASSGFSCFPFLGGGCVLLSDYCCSQLRLTCVLLCSICFLSSF